MIGQLCTFDMGYVSLTHSFALNPYTYDLEIWAQETRNIALSYGAKMRFDILNRLGVDYECDRETDGRRGRR